MNKILVGLLLGAVLGEIDGMTAWFTPAVRSQLAGIVVGSTFKGLWPEFSSVYLPAR